MGRSQNPVEAHRRKQREKEIKKNKEKRLNERDERVKHTKTVGEVKKEIKEFEKRHKHQLGEHGVKSKLDRLKKELKLVQQGWFLLAKARSCSFDDIRALRSVIA